MKNNIEEMLLRTFGLLSKAAARKRIYAKKAIKEGRQGVGHLIRAITESEKIQAHRVFSAYRGHVDLSDKYLSTLFEEEIQDIIDQYSRDLSEAKEVNNQAIIHALTQLLDVEKQIRSYFSSETGDVVDERDRNYHVCVFCGHIMENPLPDVCPICGAAQESFKEVV